MINNRYGQNKNTGDITTNNRCVLLRNTGGERFAV
jgi:hypothetical protein